MATEPATLEQALAELRQARCALLDSRREVTELHAVIHVASVEQAERDRTTCPHCQGTYPRGTGLTRHMEDCPARPDATPTVHALDRQRRELEARAKRAERAHAKALKRAEQAEQAAARVPELEAELRTTTAQVAQLQGMLTTLRRSRETSIAPAAHLVTEFGGSHVQPH